MFNVGTRVRLDRAENANACMPVEIAIRTPGLHWRYSPSWCWRYLPVRPGAGPRASRPPKSKPCSCSPICTCCGDMAVTSCNGATPLLALGRPPPCDLYRSDQMHLSKKAMRCGLASSISASSGSSDRPQTQSFLTSRHGHVKEPTISRARTRRGGHAQSRTDQDRRA